MKKFLALLLSLSLVLCSFGFVFAEEGEETADPVVTDAAETTEEVDIAAPTEEASLSDIGELENREAIERLISLGIISGYPDGTFLPERTVSRAEMAKMLIVALEYDDGGIAVYSSGLSDVADHWAKAYLGYSNFISVVAGYPDGTARPDNAVTYDEAVTMIVRALGYTDDVLEGVWPANYVAKAAELGLTEGIETGSAGATRGDVATMLDRALDIDIAGEEGDTMYVRLTEVQWEAEEWQVPYGERLVNQYGFDGAVVDSAPTIDDSIYWSQPDFYNAASSETLTILTNYKTTQQVTGWACGLSSAISVLDYYGMRGDLNEFDMAYLREGVLEPGGTPLHELVTAFEGLESSLGQEWDLYSTFDSGLSWNDDGYPVVTYEGQEMTLFEMIPMFLEQGKPIIVGWNDWGGHYQVIIGYDDMGTEATADDVLVIMDPYDTTDHLQDGYITLSVERFVWDWSWSEGWGDLLGDEILTYGIFLVASPTGWEYEGATEGEGIPADTGNRGVFTDAQLIPYPADLADKLAAMSAEEPYATVYTNWLDDEGISGPASHWVYRTGDHQNSPYYKTLDFYTMRSGGSLTLLEGYKTQQQATEYTCGLTSMSTVLNYYDVEMNEIDLAALRDKTDGLPGTTIQEMLNVIEKLDGEWNVLSSYDIVDGDSYFECGVEFEGEYVDLGDLIPVALENGIPVMVMWHEWGGHYQTVIGYDDMGTPDNTQDDVLILMDSYDTTDHNQDGYLIESYERLVYDWGNSYDADVDWGAFVMLWPAE